MVVLPFLPFLQRPWKYSGSLLRITPNIHFCDQIHQFYYSLKMSILSLASTGAGEVSFTPLALRLETGVKRMEL